MPLPELLGRATLTRLVGVEFRDVKSPLQFDQTKLSKADGPTYSSVGHQHCCEGTMVLERSLYCVTENHQTKRPAQPQRQQFSLWFKLP